MIAIVGVLAAGVITVLNPLAQLQKARDAERKSDLAQIQKTLEIYYNDNNSYPPTATFTPWPASFPSYMTTVPKDKSSGRNYTYFATADGQTYWLYASLERGVNDSQACSVIPCANAVANGLSCGSGVCNYGATSSNTSP